MSFKDSNFAEVATIKIPPEDVGRLIGKQGAQIKLLRKNTGCEININSTNKSQPLVKLKGTLESIEKAKRCIADICGGQGVAFVRDVTDITMGHLKSSWLERECNTCGVSVELKGRNLKIVSQSRSNEDVQKMKALIEERIASQTERISETIQATSDEVRIIRENPGIRQLEAQRGLKLDILKNESSFAVQLQGQKGTVQEALENIEMLIKSEGKTLKDFVPVVGAIFENCAEKKLNDLRKDIHDGIVERFLVEVTFSPTSPRIEVVGHEKAVLAAKDELQQLLQYYFTNCCATITFNKLAIPSVCGERDQHLVAMLSSNLSLSINKDVGKLWICGRPNAALAAYKKFTGKIEHWNNTNKFIPLIHSSFAGLILGLRGETIRNLQEQTGATISIERSIPGMFETQCVWIRAASPEVVEHAKQIIENILQKQNLSK